MSTERLMWWALLALGTAELLERFTDGANLGPVTLSSTSPGAGDMPAWWQTALHARDEDGVPWLQPWGALCRTDDNVTGPCVAHWSCYTVAATKADEEASEESGWARVTDEENVAQVDARLPNEGTRNNRRTLEPELRHVVLTKHIRCAQEWHMGHEDAEWYFARDFLMHQQPTQQLAATRQADDPLAVVHLRPWGWLDARNGAVLRCARAQLRSSANSVDAQETPSFLTFKVPTAQWVQTVACLADVPREANQ